MVDVGEAAPDFTVPLADGEISSFTLSEHLEEAPIVLAFFPGAFTGTCRTEMCTFENRLPAFEDVGANVYGVSVDTPFSLDAWREVESLSFGLLSDHEKDLIDAYDVREDFAAIGYYGLAKRAVFVVDTDGTISYRWVTDDATLEPDYDEVEAAAAEAAELAVGDADGDAIDRETIDRDATDDGG